MSFTKLGGSSFFDGLLFELFMDVAFCGDQTARIQSTPRWTSLDPERRGGARSTGGLAMLDEMTCSLRRVR